MKLRRIGRALPEAPVIDERPDWKQADVGFIERALRRASALSGGGWVVVDASREIGAEPRRFVLDEREWVVWRDEAGVLMAPNACPHMGAELHCGALREGRVVCPWHGLELGREGHGAWRPVPTHDDGVLVWARILADEEATPAPALPPRPARYVDAVIRMEAACEPKDIVANRLDPWHGAHYHPHSFASLRMLEVDEERLALRVAFRVAGPLCVEVDCTFHAPTRRSIVMTIVDGEGKGSVVETHASPVGPGRSAVIEATLATSERDGFHHAERFARFIRPFVEHRARRLWVEDVAYAERRYALRSAESPRTLPQLGRAVGRLLRASE